MSEPEWVRVIVEKIVPSKGSRSSYAVCRRDSEENTITFTLDDCVWNEQDDPIPGEVAYLSDVREMGKGLRALKARRNTPEQQRN